MTLRRIPHQAERRLQTLDSAVVLEDLKRLQSNRFEALSGDRKAAQGRNQKSRKQFTAEARRTLRKTQRMA